jgi:hypothetical protein
MNKHVRRRDMMQEQQEEFQTGRIYCANCFHCKLLPLSASNGVLQIRCAEGKWRKKLGQEKIYKYCTITRRYIDTCDAYADMGDSADFIRVLRKIILEEFDSSIDK